MNTLHRSGAWRAVGDLVHLCLLLSSTGCAVEMNLLEPHNLGEVDTFAPATFVDGGAVAYDGGPLLPYDASFFPDAEIPILPKPLYFPCGVDASNAALAETGQPCNFPWGCTLPQLGGCAEQDLFCEDGWLVVAISRPAESQCDAQPDLPELCVGFPDPTTDPCGLAFWRCADGAAGLSLPAAFRTVGMTYASVKNCELRTADLTLPPLLSCPLVRSDDPLPSPTVWQPDPHQPCIGSFACDSFGSPLAGPRASVRLDSFGTVYWCGNGVLQRFYAGASPSSWSALSL